MTPDVALVERARALGLDPSGMSPEDLQRKVEALERPKSDLNAVGVSSPSDFRTRRSWTGTVPLAFRAGADVMLLAAACACSRTTVAWRHGWPENVPQFRPSWPRSGGDSHR